MTLALVGCATANPPSPPPLALRFRQRVAKRARTNQPQPHPQGRLPLVNSTPDFSNRSDTRPIQALVPPKDWRGQLEKLIKNRHYFR